MKKLVVIVSLLCLTLVSKSQNLAVEGTAPNLYITHTVAPKENFYSVGRLYNQPAKSIASFNNLVMEKGLSIGQRIKIPLNAQNLDATANASSGETVSLTHIVGKGESISRIATDLNVSVQTLKQWNNLSSDNIAAGTPLVVGHLKISATPGIAKPAATAQNTNSTIGTPIATQENKQPAAEPKKEETALSAPINVTTEKKETVAAVKQEPTRQVEPAVQTADKEVAVKETEVKPAPTKEDVVKETPSKVASTRKTDSFSYTNTSSLGSVEGVFANVFTTEASQKSLNTKTGEAATFKSTSGWQDKKYYVLMNDVTPGTIVKVQSMEDKVVYAKVLGSMPEMKENNGLMIRISNAAASYLGIIDPKFPVQISFYQ